MTIHPLKMVCVQDARLLDRTLASEDSAIKLETHITRVDPLNERRQ
jgi:hypothetical protein